MTHRLHAADEAWSPPPELRASRDHEPLPARAPKPSTAPPGLFEWKPAPVTSVKPKSKKPASGNRRPRIQGDVHGTTAGYARHRRAGEKPCDPCRLAKNADSASRPRKSRAKTPPPVVERPNRCGSRAGYDDHLRITRDAPCEPCKAALSEYARGRYKARTEALGGKKQPSATPQCGTLGGRSAHRRRGEEVCPACRDAVNAHARNKKRERRAA